MKSLYVVAILAFVIAGCSNQALTGGTINSDAIGQENAREIRIDAFQFGYAPDTITINKGEKVKIIVNNLDTTHGIRIPEIGIKGDQEIEFIADKSGTFTWYCANYCGEGHTQMSGTLIVQ